MRLTVTLLTCCILSAALVEGFVGGGLSVQVQVHKHKYANTNTNTNAFVKPVSFISAKTKSNTYTQLDLSNVPAQPDENLREEDPIQFLAEEIQVMDYNAIFNTVAVVLVVVAALSHVTTIDAHIMRGWTAEETAIRIPVDNWLSYSAYLEESPLSTKAVTSATVYTIGDFIAQRTEDKTMGELDRPRLLRSLLAGLLGHGPLSHIWYDVSENLFENVLHLRDWWGTFAKVAIDQTTWGPFWNNTYILMLGIMKFDKPKNIFGEMKRTTIPLLLSGLKLWPLAHCVTYGLIPVENRLLWVDLVEIIWVTILATAAAGGAEEMEGNAEAEVLTEGASN